MSIGKKIVFKVVRRVLGIVAAVVILALIGVMFFISPIVKTAVETLGPAMTGAPVTLESVSISPLRGRVELRNLIVGNPVVSGKTYKSEYAIKLGDVDAEISIGSVFSRKIVIRELKLDDIDLNYEITSKINPANCNINDILDNVEKFSGKEEAAASEESSEDGSSSSESKRFEVDKLEMEDIHLCGFYSGSKFLDIPIQITPLNDIGADPEGVGASELAARVIVALVARSGVEITKALASGVKDLGNKVKSALDGIF